MECILSDANKCIYIYIYWYIDWFIQISDTYIHHIHHVYELMPINDQTWVYSHIHVASCCQASLSCESCKHSPVTRGYELFSHRQVFWQSAKSCDTQQLNFVRLRKVFCYEIIQSGSRSSYITPTFNTIVRLHWHSIVRLHWHSIGSSVANWSFI